MPQAIRERIALFPTPVEGSREREVFERWMRAKGMLVTARAEVEKYEKMESAAYSELLLLMTGCAQPLTGMEEQVLVLVRENLSNKEIAGRLGIAVRTVKFHICNLLRKHNVTGSRARLMRKFSNS